MYLFLFNFIFLILVLIFVNYASSCKFLVPRLCNPFFFFFLFSFLHANVHVKYLIFYFKNLRFHEVIFVVLFRYRLLYYSTSLFWGFLCKSHHLTPPFPSTLITSSSLPIAFDTM